MRVAIPIAERRKSSALMPIRFRCPFRNQLLGISARKEGSVVRCPTCAGQVRVPKVEPERTFKPEADPMLFERNDFDEIFPPAQTEGPGPPARSAAPAGQVPAS